MVETRTELTALHADVVDYSRHLADDRDSTTETMGRYATAFEKAAGDAAGVLVEFAGDSFMLVFPRVIDAMGAAIDLSTMVERQNQGLEPHRRLVFRMGLDTGSVDVNDGRYFGEPLNIAARIESIARPGGISVSGRVYSALDEPALRFVAIGRQRLKNIPEDTDVFDFADLPTNQSALQTHAGLHLETPAISVVPIHADDVLAAERNTVRTDLIHRLNRIPQLSVLDTREEGTHQATYARYTLESGLSKSGDRLRAHAQLFDTVSLNIVKSHRVDGPADALFDLSEELADAMGSYVEVELVVGAPAGLYAELDDPAAIENVHLGWYYLNGGTSESWSRAVSRFEAVAAAHPDKPYGHVLLAFTHWVGAVQGWSGDYERGLDLALESARRGEEVGDPTAMAQMTKAAVLMSRGDEGGAVAAIEGVTIERPTCDTTFGIEGSVRRYLGEWDKAIDLEDRAMRLTGVNKPWYPTVKACSLLMSGRSDQAMSVAEMVLEHHPQNLEALLILAAAQSRLGLARRARATASRIHDQFPAVDVEQWLARNPFRDKGVVDAWRSDLVAAGVLGTPSVDS